MASPTPEFAPFCETGAQTASPLSQCQVPIVEESSTFCSDKAPYNLILMDEGLTYEVLTEGFVCSDAGMKNDKQISEDEMFKSQDDVQKITDDYITKVDEMSRVKEAEILEI